MMRKKPVKRSTRPQAGTPRKRGDVPPMPSDPRELAQAMFEVADYKMFGGRKNTGDGNVK